MFSSKHVIWKIANIYGELDDWLPHAEYLIGEWSIQNSDTVEFKNTREIIIAGWLLEDDLLPASARAAFARLMLKTINEADDKKIRLDCLHIKPPKPGRKENRGEAFTRIRAVRLLIQEGISYTEAYGIVAEKHHKSPDTIRRDYERAKKRAGKRKQTWENDS